MIDVRRERQAARRRTLQVVTDRRLQRRVIVLRDLRVPLALTTRGGT